MGIHTLPPILPNFKAEGILEIKALTMSKAIFRQCQILESKAFKDLEDRHGKRSKYLGYVMEPWDSSVGEVQTFWLIIQLDSKIFRIRDSELFWVIREPGDTGNEKLEELRGNLPQIFIK